ncbi:MAG: enoyl-CoA hydratase-related protein, partial [Acidimicrobiia bacterium]
MTTYDTTPQQYRHWALAVDVPVATLTLSAGRERGSGCFDGAEEVDPELSSSLQVDIELADALQRLRFEYPEVGVVVVTGATDGAFSGIAAIPAGSACEVTANVWSFRHELHCAIEDASANSGQRWLAALNGPAAGPGYELALTTDEIVLVDDGRSAVALPDVSASGDLPTGALARLLDKRHVRPDLVDAFCSRAGGVSGCRAVEWGLVDAIAPASCFTEFVADRARAAGSSGRGPAAEAVALEPLQREEFDGGFAYPNLRVEIDDERGEAALTIVGPPNHECFAPEPGPKRLRSRWWPLAVCREFDDALLLLRTNWPGVRSVVLRTEGDPLAVASADVALTSGYEHDWFVREVVLFWKRTLKRVDAARQSVIALVEPGSCFVGTLLELALAADEIQVVGAPTGPDAPPVEIFLTGMNFGPLPRAGGLSRLESRFLDRTDLLADLAQRVGDPIPAAEALELG